MTVLGWIIRLWETDSKNPEMGRAIWTGGPATSQADGVGKIRQFLAGYPGEKDPKQTCGYLVSRVPDRRLLEEFERRDVVREAVVDHPAVVVFCPMYEALPGD